MSLTIAGMEEFQVAITTVLEQERREDTVKRYFAKAPSAGGSTF